MSAHPSPIPSHIQLPVPQPSVPTGSSKPQPKGRRDLRDRLNLSKWGLGNRGKNRNKGDDDASSRQSEDSMGVGFLRGQIPLSGSLLDVKQGDKFEHKPTLPLNIPANLSSDELWALTEKLISQLLRPGLPIKDALKVVFEAAELGLLSLEHKNPISLQKDESQVRQQRCTALLDIAQSIKSITEGEEYKTDRSSDTAWQALQNDLPTLLLNNKRWANTTNAPINLEILSMQKTQNIPAEDPPKSTRLLSTAEKVALLQSSRLNGGKFPPWDVVASQNVYINTITDQVKRDADPHPPPSLAPSQKVYFKTFCRARNALGSEDGDCDGMKSLRPSSLVQDVLPDCSLVASLIVLAAWRERFLESDSQTSRSQQNHHPMKDILSDLFEHYDPSIQAPVVSLNGTYRIRLFFNGTWRRVIVDDIFPVSRNSRLLHVFDTANHSLMWPALLEKAYLTVRGGYGHFVGSSPAADLSTLTGWIPEQIHLQRDHSVVSPERVWDRIKDWFEMGRVMVTLGTGSVDEGLELEQWHTYAVVKLEQSSTQTGLSKRLLVRNPLGKADSEGVIRTQPSRWIDLDQVTLHFDSLYLNWDPRLFTQREDIHFKWDLAPLSAAAREEAYLVDSPQFSIKCDQDWNGSVWVLLSRHFQNDNQDMDQDQNGVGVGIGEFASSGTATAIDIPPGFISLVAFSNAGFKVLDTIHTHPIGRTRYVDAPFCLLRLDLEGLLVSKSTQTSSSLGPESDKSKGFVGNPSLSQNDPITIVLCQQNMPIWTHRFSLSVFYSGHGKITLERAQIAHPYVAEVKSEWRRGNGKLFEIGLSLTGSHQNDGSTIINNRRTFPSQFSISSMVVMLESLDVYSSSSKLLNIKLIKALPSSTSEPLSSISSRQIIADSGNYAPRFCFLLAPWELFSKVSLPNLTSLSPLGASSSAGNTTEVQYHLLANTYSPETMGNFRIRCFSKYPIRIQQVYGYEQSASSNAGNEGGGEGDRFHPNRQLDGKFMIAGPTWKMPGTTVHRQQWPYISYAEDKIKDTHSSWFSTLNHFDDGSVPQSTLLACLPLHVTRYARFEPRINAFFTLLPSSSSPLASPSSGLVSPISTSSSSSLSLGVKRILVTGSKVPRMVNITARLLAHEVRNGKPVNFQDWFNRIRSANHRGHVRETGRKETSKGILLPQGLASMNCTGESSGTVASFETQEQELELSLCLPAADLWPGDGGGGGGDSSRNNDDRSGRHPSNDNTDTVATHVLVIECTCRSTQRKSKPVRGTPTTAATPGLIQTAIMSNNITNGSSPIAHIHEDKPNLTVELRVSGMVSETIEKDCVQFGNWVIS